MPEFNRECVYEYEDKNNNNGTITRTIIGESFPTSVNFSGRTGLVSLSYLNTNDVTSMEDMFKDCSNLITLDLSSFNTDNVYHKCVGRCVLGIGSGVF